MAEQTNELNLYQKLAKIRKVVEVIKKNKKGYGYTYVNEEEILSKITGLMDKYELSLIPGIVPNTLQVAPYHYMKTKSTESGEIYEEHANEVLVTADATWRWVNNNNPEEFIEVPWALVGQQSDASQAFGSGLTYTSRYFLLKYFQVSTTNDDPDSWRTKQREAEEMENRVITERLTEQIDKLVNDYLAEHSDERERVIELIKKKIKVKGKPSSNYFAITDPQVAKELLDTLTAEFSQTNETATKVTKGKKGKGEEVDAQ